MASILGPDELERLRGYSTCTIANAIELFRLRPPAQGLLHPAIRCFFPELGGLIGYAVTSRIQARQPASGNLNAPMYDYWDYAQNTAQHTGAPCIAVVQDLDPEPVGALWGDVNANVHRAMGFRGAVTNGGVRDLPGSRQAGFHFFGGAVLTSHAHVHFVDYDTPVEVGGVVVHPGDLLHGDQHGVVVIPAEVAPELAQVCEHIERREQEIIRYCQSPGFTLDGLKATRDAAHRRWPGRPPAQRE